jgi:hypothetical protein
MEAVSFWRLFFLETPKDTSGQQELAPKKVSPESIPVAIVTFCKLRINYNFFFIIAIFDKNTPIIRWFPKSNYQVRCPKQLF